MPLFFIASVLFSFHSDESKSVNINKRIVFELLLLHQLKTERILCWWFFLYHVIEIINSFVKTSCAVSKLMFLVF